METGAGMAADYLDTLVLRGMKKTKPVQPLILPYYSPPLQQPRVAARSDRDWSDRIEIPEDTRVEGISAVREKGTIAESILAGRLDHQDATELLSQQKAGPSTLSFDTIKERNHVTKHGSFPVSGKIVSQDMPVPNAVERSGGTWSEVNDSALHMNPRQVQRNTGKDGEEPVLPERTGFQAEEKPGKSRKGILKDKEEEKDHSTSHALLPDPAGEKRSIPEREVVVATGGKKDQQLPKSHSTVQETEKPRVSVSIAPVSPVILKTIQPPRAIHVSIGRIEIRAVAPLQKQERAPVAVRVMTLHDYLNQRKGRTP